MTRKAHEPPPPAPAGGTTPLWVALAPCIFLVFWSGGFTAVKLALADIEPLTMLAVRYAIVVVVLAPLWLIFRPPAPARRIDWLHLALIGMLVQGGHFALITIAMKVGLTAGAAAIIVGLQPILVGLAAPMIVGERVSLLRWAGLGLGLTGAALVILAQGGIGTATWAGIGAGLAAVVCLTTGTLYEKRCAVSGHVLTANLVQCAAACLLTGGLALLLETGDIRWTGTLGGVIAYLVIANTLIAMSLLFAMLRRGEASRVSSLFFLVPAVSALIAWPILGEAMAPLGLLGLALAAAGVLITMRAPS